MWRRILLLVLLGAFVTTMAMSCKPKPGEPEEPEKPPTEEPEE